MNIIQDIEHDIEVIAEEIGEWITPELDTAEKLYDTLTDEEKKAATWAYGVIAVINDNLDKEGALIIPIIQKAFPNLSIDVLHGFLEMLLNNTKTVQSEIPLTLEDAINQVAAYLKTLTGSFWGIMSQALGTELTIIFSPTSIPQKIASTAELIYQVIVKPKVSTL